MAYLATFLQAGMSPTTAWRELALVEPHLGVPGDVVVALEEHPSVHNAVVQATRTSSHPWRVLGACWWVSRTAGAPLGPALMSLSQAIRDLDATTREIEAALAGPRATMRLIAALPVVAVLGGILGGGPGLGVLLGSPAGWSLLAAGVVMMAGAWWWLRLLAARASPNDDFISIDLDLFQIATSGGLPPERALELVTQVMKDFDLPRPQDSTAHDLSALSRRAGVPVGTLAGVHATLRREKARVDAHERVQKLAVQVVVPLGLLVLPAFVLIAVAPMAVGLWQGGFS